MHWRRLVRIIGRQQRVVITDESMGAFQYLGHVPGMTPNSTPMIRCRRTTYKTASFVVVKFMTVLNLMISQFS